MSGGSTNQKETLTVNIIGAGLAGSEVAFQLAERGIKVRLYEQKPIARTPAQSTDHFAELVCSNSFRGASLANAVGLLKEEMARLGSLIMRVGNTCRVPAGGAFAVDRNVFSDSVSTILKTHRNIEVVAEQVTAIPEASPLDRWVIATGPLTADALAADLEKKMGEGRIAYYDAIAPVVAADSIDESKVFRASRYDKGGDDAYINCPLNKDEYQRFVSELNAAAKVQPKSFEKLKYFEGCLPIEVMAERGERTLAFGPMKPVGLTDPRTGRWPYAVVQLRAEDLDRSAYNLVGFQTRLTWPEQKRVFGLIPGLENAEWQRYGTIHRNTFVDAPVVLDDALMLKAQPYVYLSGQITGVEGYVESAAGGMLTALSILGDLAGLSSTDFFPPRATALGALYGHLRAHREGPTPRSGTVSFQPSNVVFSMFPSIGDKLKKRARYVAIAKRALVQMAEWTNKTETVRDFAATKGISVIPEATMDDLPPIVREKFVPREQEGTA